MRPLLGRSKSLVCGDEILKSAHQKVAEKNQRLKKPRDRLKEKVQEIARLRAELAKAQRQIFRYGHQVGFLL